MTNEEHIALGKKLYEEADINDALPEPYYFEWAKGMPPRILDAEGRCVAVISTGTLSGSHETKVIMATVKKLLTGVELLGASHQE